MFYRDGDTVLHTHTSYGNSIDLLLATDMYLDLTPLGRAEQMPKHHDRY